MYTYGHPDTLFFHRHKPEQQLPNFQAREGPSNTGECSNLFVEKWSSKQGTIPRHRVPNEQTFVITSIILRHVISNSSPLSSLPLSLSLSSFKPTTFNLTRPGPSRTIARRCNRTELATNTSHEIDRQRPRRDIRLPRPQRHASTIHTVVVLQRADIVARILHRARCAAKVPE